MERFTVALSNDTAALTEEPCRAGPWYRRRPCPAPAPGEVDANGRLLATLLGAAERALRQTWAAGLIARTFARYPIGELV